MITISFALPSDGRIRSVSGNYTTAVNGSSLDVDTTSTTFGTWGQSAGFAIYQYFISFPYIADSSQAVMSAYFEFRVAVNAASGPSRSMEVREYNWGSSLSTGNWRTPSQLNSLTELANNSNPQNASGGQSVRCGGIPGLTDRLDSSGPVRVVLCSSRNRNQSGVASGESATQFYTGDTSPNAPRVVITSVPVSMLTRSMATQVMLSDGTQVYLDPDSPGIATSYTLKHRDNNDNITTFFTNATSARRGVQSYSLCRDSSNNLFLTHSRSDGQGQTLNVRGFSKGAGYTWTSGADDNHVFSLNAQYGATFNNVVTAWHSVGNGTVVVLAANSAGRNSGTSVSYALLSASFLLTGSGSLIRDSGQAVNLFYINPGHTGYNSFVNETSSLMDICAAPNTSDRGFIVTATRQITLDGAGVPSIARYQLNSTGTGISSATVSLGGGLEGASIRKDANAKCRLISLSTSQFVVVTADPGSDRGITVCLVQNSGSSTNFNALSQSRIGEISIPSMPTPPTIAVSSTWDAVYDPNTNWVWIYYISATNPNALMKTRVDLSTGFALGSAIQVTSVGTGGSVNLALRAHRGITTGDKALIMIANRTSGGTHSLLSVVDSLNAPPFAPTLTPKSNFNASNNAVFGWTFNDPNEGDIQSSFQLEISLLNGTIVHDTGKTSSSTTQYTLLGGTISNGQSYRWRVRTWDSEDQVGPYSNHGTFSTSSSGVLDILEPAEDNPPDVLTKDNLVVWEVTGEAQAAYRVVVIRTSNESVFLNTGWVTSTDTSYLIQDMASDVEYRIEVTARNGIQVETNTASVLLTPSYGTPEQPVLSLTSVHNEGYVLIQVENPEPQGDRPEPVRNDIFRSQNTIQYILVGTTEPNGETRDYSAADGVSYKYFARAVAE